MSAFIEIPTSKKAIAFRKIVHGVGVNDAEYITNLSVDGKRVVCPYYDRWCGMLRRCYDAKFQEIHPTYKGCSVVKEWLTFSSFKEWMRRHEWKGNHLDKDILSQGNKIYSPSTCLFVTQEINTLLTNHARGRGKYPQGVSFNKGKYRARCNIDGKSRFLGHFEDISMASAAYKDFKYALINQAALKQKEPLRSSLLAYKIT